MMRRLSGSVTVDDIDVLEQEATEDIYRLAGAGEVTKWNSWRLRCTRLLAPHSWLVICRLGTPLRQLHRRL